MGMSPDRVGPRCFAIVGPTACGKTDLALALAREFPVEIISMDSAMVYRGMDVGTAKPAAAILDELPHHLIDIRDPEQSYSAGRFASDARRLIDEIASRGKLALIVGGTMLYLKALRDGLAKLPERNSEVRAEIDARARAVGWAALHAKLAVIDPVAARRIEPSDRQRIQRALEVHAVTGRSLTELQRATLPAGVAVDAVALLPADRAAHARDIERRFRDMVEKGLVEEVRRLRRRPGLGAESPSMRSVGYRQVWAWLDGRWDWPEAENRAIIATRQLAKRQLTWLRQAALSGRFDAGDAALPAKLGRTVRRLIESA